MRLVTFTVDTPLGTHRRIGAMAKGGIVDLNFAYAGLLAASGKTGRAAAIANTLLPSDMAEFLAVGEIGMDAARRAIDFADGGAGLEGQSLLHDQSEVTLLAPVARPNSIRDTISFEGHMKNFERRTGKPTSALWYEMPAYYKGNPRAVIGPGAPIVWPAYTEKLDYELEFGIYIGKRGRDIPADEAGAFIAGYTIFNDVSARDVIPGEVSLNLGPAKGKDMDTGNVMGPCLVTPDELDPTDLGMTARINGEVWSEGRSSDMYWSFPQIIEHISRAETLYPGDFIGSGTVANGCGDELERWIRPGDVVELEIEGIGVLRNPIVREG